MDQYGRMVAHLNVDGLDVNTEQIRRGMAWEYSNFHSNKTLIDLRNEAKQASRGLWAQSKSDPTVGMAQTTSQHFFFASQLNCLICPHSGQTEFAKPGLRQQEALLRNVFMR
jgi:hypothetical protein